MKSMFAAFIVLFSVSSFASSLLVKTLETGDKLTGKNFNEGGECLVEVVAKEGKSITLKIDGGETQVELIRDIGALSTGFDAEISNEKFDLPNNRQLILVKRAYISTNRLTKNTEFEMIQNSFIDGGYTQKLLYGCRNLKRL